MNDQTPHRMTADEYLPWATGQEGRWELIDGRPIKRPRQTVGHVDAKMCVWLLLTQSIELLQPEFHVIGDGTAVRIDRNNVNEPDAIVYAGSKRPGNSLEVPDPLIVVEVVSPTSGSRDKIRKRRDYFSLASVEHYLVIEPEARTLLHFDRANWHGDGRLLGEADTADLTPPGLRLPVRRCFDWK